MRRHAALNGCAVSERRGSVRRLLAVDPREAGDARQASADSRDTASSRETVPLRGSHQRALVSAMPVRPEASSSARSGSAPVSAAMTSAIASTQAAGAAVDDRADVVVVAQVGLEDQAERLALGVDEVVVRADGGVDPRPVVVGAAHRLGDPLGQLGDVLLEQREVELPLAREVLVEHGLADPGAVGDVVHRRGVEALGDEDVLGGAQQLQAARTPRQAGGAPVVHGGGAWRLHDAADVTGGFTNRMSPGRGLPSNGCPSHPARARRPVRHAAARRADRPAVAGEEWPSAAARCSSGARRGPARVTVPTGPRERALYVHGLGGASTNWTDLAALLAVRFDGWAVDLPGFGRSAPPRRARYSIRGHVRAVVDVLEHVRDQPGDGAGRPVHLVGNSLGGLVSVLVASRRPDLVASLTLDLAGDAGLPRADGVQPRAAAAAPARRPVARRAADRRDHARGERPGAWCAMCFGEPSRVPPERLEQAVQEMRERAEQPWADRALVGSMRGLITSYLRVGAANAWRAARSLTLPTLVVWGDRDRLVDRRSRPARGRRPRRPAAGARGRGARGDARGARGDRAGGAGMVESTGRPVAASPRGNVPMAAALLSTATERETLSR